MTVQNKTVQNSTKQRQNKSLGGRRVHIPILSKNKDYNPFNVATCTPEEYYYKIKCERKLSFAKQKYLCS